jgi:hypothetical protein
VKPPPSSTRHLDLAGILDYLEQRLSEDRRRRVEEHLGQPCPDCRARLREVGLLLDRMRTDRVPLVPETLRRRALEIFAAGREPAPPERLMTRLARLLFDSAAAPLPAAARRRVGEARRLRFALGEDALEIECELESAGSWTLRGQLAAADPALHRVELVVGAERLSAWPDAAGAFVLGPVPRGRARLTVAGPRGRYRLPGIEL